MGELHGNLPTQLGAIPENKAANPDILLHDTISALLLTDMKPIQAGCNLARNYAARRLEPPLSYYISPSRSSQLAEPTRLGLRFQTTHFCVGHN
jgi:hypothetical protein